MDADEIAKLGPILRDLSQTLDALRMERYDVEFKQRVIGRLETEEQRLKECLKCVLTNLGIPYDERLDPEFFAELYRQLAPKDQTPKYTVVSDS